MDPAHLTYSKHTRKIIDFYLQDHFSKEKALQLQDAVRRQYQCFLSDLPCLGGRKNGQAQSVYDCIALFALYEILPVKPSLGVLEELSNQVFVPRMSRAFYANLNLIPMQKLAWRIFSRVSGKAEKHRKDWPGNYHMEVEPCSREEGIRYRFTSCPIADFAGKHGYTHLMPAMCNPDYPMLAALKAGLIRRKTCAQDDCCDYWIVGSRSNLLKEHPVFRDEQGYLRNR